MYIIYTYSTKTTIPNWAFHKNHRMTIILQYRYMDKTTCEPIPKSKRRLMKRMRWKKRNETTQNRLTCDVSWKQVRNRYFALYSNIYNANLLFNNLYLFCTLTHKEKSSEFEPLYPQINTSQLTNQSVRWWFSVKNYLFFPSQLQKQHVSDRSITDDKEFSQNPIEVNL